jgi:hypothetical protein
VRSLVAALRPREGIATSLRVVIRDEPNRVESLLGVVYDRSVSCRRGGGRGREGRVHSGVIVIVGGYGRRRLWSWLAS